jgi:hypothetical protein
MSYSRDRDQMTRGVGAIAAIDKAHPGRAAARDRRVHESVAEQDRRAAGVAFGPRGGLGALGRINLANLGAQGFRGGQVIAPDHTSGTGGGSGAGGQAPGTNTSSGTIHVGPRTSGNVLGTGGRATPTGFEGRPIPPKVPGKTLAYTLLQTGLPPKTTKPPPAPVISGGGGVIVGGGGSGGGFGPKPVLTQPSINVDPLPDVASSGRPWGLYAAIALGVYLITKED